MALLTCILQVDFYIGTDSPQLIEQLEQPVNALSQTFDGENSSIQQPLTVSDEDGEYLSDPGITLAHEDSALTRKPAHRSASAELESYPILSASSEEEAMPSHRPAHLTAESPDDRGTPSPAASAMTFRRESIGGKVTFVVGKETVQLTKDLFATILFFVI